MLNLQEYGSNSSSSETESETENSNDTLTAHLKPIDKSQSIVKDLAICAAPVVVATGNSEVSRAINPHEKEVMYNPKYDELFAPVAGPENPFLTQQMRANRNTLTGFVEKAHISAFQFENQRRTFHSYGYALDPSVDGDVSDGPNYVGHLQAAYDTEGKTVFEKTEARAADKRKRLRNNQPDDIEGFLGPWGKFEDKKTVAVPNEKEKAELEEILSKKQRRNKVYTEEKPLEEKSILHIKDAFDYQGRSFLHPPHDVGVNLRSNAPPDRCFLPKAHIHTWTGHTKGVTAIRFFPKSAHLLLSASFDSRVKLWEVYNERRCIRTFSGHKQAVKDISFNAKGTQFVSACEFKFILIIMQKLICILFFSIRLLYQIMGYRNWGCCVQIHIPQKTILCEISS